MTYLLHISIGPVQGFISAFKKTRDLQAGSRLLVEMVNAVASTLQEEGATLIFPPNVLKVSSAGASEPEGQASAANVIVSVVKGDPKPLVGKCRDAAVRILYDRWTGFDGAKLFVEKKCPGSIYDDLGKAQIESFLEFFAGWAEYDGSDYKGARKLANARMAASKSVRVFGPAPSADSPSPKSPQNPHLESVLKTSPGGGEQAYQISKCLQERLLLGPYEALDAISLIKRFYFVRDNVDSRAKYAAMTSTRTVAVQDLLNKAKDSKELLDLVTICNELNERSRIHIDEGTILFNIEDDLHAATGGDVALLNRVGSVRKSFLDAVNKGRAPRPYYAVILADGDGMGTFLDQFDNPVDHKGFSGTLSDFSGGCETIVLKHDGLHVYAGGDDVLALCPVGPCLKLAQELQQRFDLAMGSYPMGVLPTLTVAVGICPINDDLQDCIAYAHRLEKSKKCVQGKNALVLGARVRSGSDHGVAISWACDPVAVFNDLLEGYQSDWLPRGFGGDVMQLASLFEAFDANESHIGSEYDVLCEKKVSSENSEFLKGLLRDEWRNPNGLRLLAELLAVAHFMSRRGGEA